jgi:hypothetical protein
VEIKISRLDLKRTRDNWPDDMPFSPAFIYKRPVTPVERWHVVTARIRPGEAPDISDSYEDTYIRIPVFPYKLPPDADLAFAKILELALTCSAHIPAVIKKLHIVTGFPVDLLYADDIKTHTGICYWFGFAYLT